MSTLIASLYATITGDSSGLKKSLAGAKTDLQSTAKQMDATGVASMKAGAKMALMGIAAGAAVGAVAGIGKFMKDSVTNTIAYAKSVEDVARFTGMTAEESSKFIQIADDLRIDYSKLTMGMKTAVRQGIIPSIEGIKELAKEYQTLQSPLEKSAFALKYFGKAGMDMQKFLELAPEQLEEMAKSAEELGLVLGDEEIQNARKYYEEVDNLGDAWEGLSLSIGTKAVPALTSFVTLMNDLITLDGDTWFQDGSDASANFINNLFGLETHVKKLGDIFRESKDDIAGSAIALGDYTLWGNKVFDASGDIAEGVGNSAAAFERMRAAAEGVNKSLGDMKFDFIMEGFGSFSDNIVQQTALLLTYKRIIGEINEATYQSSMAKLDELTVLERLNAGAESGIVSQGEYFGIIKDGVIGVEEVNDAFGETTDLMDKNIERFGTAGQSVDQFSKDAQASMSEVEGAAQSATSTIEGISSSAWAASGAVAAVASSINSLQNKEVTVTVKFNYIGMTGDWKTGKGIWEERAGGGPVTAGNPYIVGESGPEMFVPNTSGRIVANAGGGNKGGGVGGDTINIYNNSTGAAALTMAIIAQSHRARLSRSMGG